MNILISAGHSTVPPRDPGAVGNGFTESYLALELRDLVADLLREKGLSVIEDGADGVNEPLKKAIALARQSDIAVEFHWNAGVPAATGIEVLSKPDKKALSQKLAGAIHSATGLKLRGDDGWKSDSSGQHHRLGFCEAGGVIVETCFISSPVDMNRYTSTKGHVAANLAEVIASAATHTLPSDKAKQPDDQGGFNNPQEKPPIYIVQPGDTLWNIAQKFQTTVAALKAKNGLSDPDVIQPGVELTI